MKYIKNRILRILAATVAVAIIGSILFIANAFVGNPISAGIADKAIKQYVDKNYSSYDLKVDKAKYEFKDGAYWAMAKSKTSIDTKFPIYYSKGKVQRDEYDFYVVKKLNTMQRLSDEYSAVAIKVMDEKLGYNNNTTRVGFEKDEYENVNSNIKLDMKFDKTISLKTEVTIRIKLDEPSLENIAKVLVDSHKAFMENGCNFSKYNFDAENKDTYVMVNNITAKDIEGGDLINLLEKAKENKSGTGISVLIKGEYK